MPFFHCRETVGSITRKYASFEYCKASNAFRIEAYWIICNKTPHSHLQSLEFTRLAVNCEISPLAYSRLPVALEDGLW
jgi:hypothetical protein